ncbi:MAG: carboxypeptidase-like regulatory domain-containing protein [Pyrinomonadaceae bacterium]
MRRTVINVYALLLLPLCITVGAGPGGGPSRLRGQVTDLLGHPITGAEIEVVAAGVSQRFKTSSRVDGSYDFADLPTGQVTTTIYSPGFVRESLTVLLRPGETARLEMGLEVIALTDWPPIDVSGEVKDREGKPLPEASVTLVCVFNRRIAFSGMTNGDGRYRLTAESPGQYIAYASKPEFSASASTLTLSPDLPREQYKVDMVLTPLRVR